MIAAAVAAFFSYIMPARTNRGAQIATELDGLAMYMGVAERHRLKMLAPPKQTPQLFETLLPYAFALGCAETWANSFAEILEKASYTPQWDSAGMYSFSDSMYLTRTLSQTLSDGMRSAVV